MKIQCPKGLTLTEILFVVAIIGLLAAIAIPSLSKVREMSQRKTCINSLMQIDAAKEQYAIDYNLSDGDSVDDSQVNTYIKTGAPACPGGGGSYTYGNIGTDPACSLGASQEHTIP
jgi:prepilin-type N-terminal cleavage/methylation domain-containing protein